MDIRALYDAFDMPVTDIDCGQMCAPLNPRRKPFCCDICEAVPAAHHAEWDYLRRSTRLWHAWRGDECPDEQDADRLRAETPAHMILLACLGPAECQRPYRALSCRQFPFFPYITSQGRFLGLSIEWAFERVCWVLQNLGRVTPGYRAAFVRTYDDLFYTLPGEFDSYAALSEEMRATFAAQRRRIPLLHRNGRDYLLSPRSERLARTLLTK
jgi:hypothetical protein